MNVHGHLLEGRQEAHDIPRQVIPQGLVDRCRMVLERNHTRTHCATSGSPPENRLARPLEENNDTLGHMAIDAQSRPVNTTQRQMAINIQRPEMVMAIEDPDLTTINNLRLVTVYIPHPGMMAA